MVTKSALMTNVKKMESVRTQTSTVPQLMTNSRLQHRIIWKTRVKLNLLLDIYYIRQSKQGFWLVELASTWNCEYILEISVICTATSVCKVSSSSVTASYSKLSIALFSFSTLFLGDLCLRTGVVNTGRLVVGYSSGLRHCAQSDDWTHVRAVFQC